MPKKQGGSKKKVFILDTNVILHDSSCTEHFQEHDIIICSHVLEELDDFKKGNVTNNYNARAFTRRIASFDDKAMFNGGVSLGKGRGCIRLKPNKYEYHNDLSKAFPRKKKDDNEILNFVYCFSADPKEKEYEEVVLVSKDVNLRMKACMLGINAEDYSNDNVDVEHLYSGSRLEEGVNSQAIDSLYEEGKCVPVDDFNLKSNSFSCNEFIVLKNGKKSALATFVKSDGEREGHFFRHVSKRQAYGIIPKNAEQSFAVHALLNPEVKLVTISGKAGTGKTLMALAAALEARSSYRQIVLARPIVPLSNKDIGFLPGDINSKIKPYMQPLYDNLAVIRSQFPEKSEMFQRLQKMLDEEKLIIEPLAYIRGRSLVKMYMIVDEAQNLTPHEVKTIVTRAGEGTKIIFTGDICQIDHPYLGINSNGLSVLIDKMKDQRLYAHIELKKGERSELAELGATIL